MSGLLMLPFTRANPCLYGGVPRALSVSFDTAKQAVYVVVSGTDGGEDLRRALIAAYCLHGEARFLEKTVRVHTEYA